MGVTTLGGLLANARKFFQGLGPATESAAQAYRIVCHCGQRLSGDRNSSYQALRCPACGGGLFVLPRSPLPEPEGSSTISETREPRRPAPSPRIDDSPIALKEFVAKKEPEPSEDDEIQWDDEVPEEDVSEESDDVDSAGSGADPVELAVSDTLATKKAAPRESSRKKPDDPKHSPKSKGTRSANQEKPAPAPAPRPSLGEFLLQHRNALLLTMVAVVVFSTVAIRLYRTHWRQLPAVAERGRTEGLAALDAGEFVKANQLLGDARRAVELLGDAYQGAEAIRQGAKEAAIIAKLIHEGLEDLLDDASQSEPPDWRDRFQKLYQGQTVIIQAQVATIPDGRGEGNYSLDYRILPTGEGGKPKTEGVIDLKGFRLLDILKPKVGDTLTFGAKVSSFQFDLEKNRWVVDFEPDSGVTMTHEKALEALGWPSLNDSLVPESIH